MPVPSKPCETCVCSSEKDPDSNTNLVKCQPVTCDKDCQEVSTKLYFPYYCFFPNRTILTYVCTQVSAIEFSGSFPKVSGVRIAALTIAGGCLFHMYHSWLTFPVCQTGLRVPGRSWGVLWKVCPECMHNQHEWNHWDTTGNYVFSLFFYFLYPTDNDDCRRSQAYFLLILGLLFKLGHMNLEKQSLHCIHKWTLNNLFMMYWIWMPGDASSNVVLVMWQYISHAISLTCKAKAHLPASKKKKTNFQQVCLGL